MTTYYCTFCNKHHNFARPDELRMDNCAKREQELRLIYCTHFKHQKVKELNTLSTELKKKGE